MTTGNFQACLAFALNQEGGWSMNPKDPGGATMKGVTIATFQRYHPGATVDDLRNITYEQLTDIYRDGYWDAVRGDDLPSGVDLMVFDFGVNAGPARSVTFLQRAVGVAEDGIIGPISLAAIGKTSPVSMISTLAGLQRAHYRSLATFQTFGAGCMARTDQRVTFALRISGPPPAVAPSPIAPSPTIADKHAALIRSEIDAAGWELVWKRSAKIPDEAFPMEIIRRHIEAAIKEATS